MASTGDQTRVTVEDVEQDSPLFRAILSTLPAKIEQVRRAEELLRVHIESTITLWKEMEVAKASLLRASDPGTQKVHVLGVSPEVMDRIDEVQKYVSKISMEVKRICDSAVQTLNIFEDESRFFYSKMAVQLSFSYKVAGSDGNSVHTVEQLIKQILQGRFHLARLAIVTVSLDINEGIQKSLHERHEQLRKAFSSETQPEHSRGGESLVAEQLMLARTMEVRAFRGHLEDVIAGLVAQASKWGEDSGTQARFAAGWMMPGENEIVPVRSLQVKAKRRVNRTSSDLSHNSVSLNVKATEKVGPIRRISLGADRGAAEAAQGSGPTGGGLLDWRRLRKVSVESARKVLQGKYMEQATQTARQGQRDEVGLHELSSKEMFLATPSPALESGSISTPSAPPRKKEGVLWLKLRDDPSCNRWRETWVVVSGSAYLTEFPDWKEPLSNIHGYHQFEHRAIGYNGLSAPVSSTSHSVSKAYPQDGSTAPIDLRLATVRPARDINRSHCLETITRTSGRGGGFTRRIYQATSDSELQEWLGVIRQAIENVLVGSHSVRQVDKVAAEVEAVDREKRRQSEDFGRSGVSDRTHRRIERAAFSMGNIYYESGESGPTRARIFDPMDVSLSKEDSKKDWMRVGAPFRRIRRPSSSAEQSGIDTRSFDHVNRLRRANQASMSNLDLAGGAANLFDRMIEKPGRFGRKSFVDDTEVISQTSKFDRIARYDEVSAPDLGRVHRNLSTTSPLNFGFPIAEAPLTSDPLPKSTEQPTRSNSAQERSKGDSRDLSAHIEQFVMRGFAGRGWRAAGGSSNGGSAQAATSAISGSSEIEQSTISSFASSNADIYIDGRDITASSLTATSASSSGRSGSTITGSSVVTSTESLGASAGADDRGADLRKSVQADRGSEESQGGMLNRVNTSKPETSDPKPSLSGVTIFDIAARAGNDACADCGAPNPRWATLTIQMQPCVQFVCINCAGRHRSLGVHISKIRSLDLDMCWSDPELLRTALEWGNVRACAYWGAVKVGAEGASDADYWRKKYVEAVWQAACTISEHSGIMTGSSEAA